MDSTQGVTPGESPTGTEDVTPVVSSPTDPQAVIAESAPVADRTPEQMFRELQRKFEAQQTQNSQILQYLSALQPQQQQAPQQPVNRELTDDELWTMAQAGDRQAFILHQQRITDRRLAESQKVQGRAQIVDRQLAALFSRYPVLRDPSHELTQIVNSAYRTFMESGYPAGKETMLSAATAAIVDHPEIVSQFHGAPAVARETSRQQAVRGAQTGTTGVTHRTAPATGAPQKVSDAEARLAKNMGVKDPAAAKKRFLERNADGRSSISPTVAAALGDIPENF